MTLAKKVGAHSSTLGAVRRESGLHQLDLAERSGRDKNYISRLETSEEPSWALLVELCTVHMPCELEDLEARVWAVRRSQGLLPLVPDSPIPLTEADLREIRRVSGPVGRKAAEHHEELMIRALRAEKARQARADAFDRCDLLLAATPKARRRLLDEPVFRTFAVAERLCDLSEAAVAKSWRKGLKIARLAWRVARHLPGSEAWRAMIIAYTQAFIANAWRVAGHLQKADTVFACASADWKRHRAGDPDRIFPDWRLPDLEASLRRDQRRFEEALKLHAEARADAPPEALARVLVKLASTYDQMFEASQAEQVLREAAPLVAAAAEPRLTHGHSFLMCVNLCHLGRHGEAATWLRVARAQAPALGSARDLTKLRWLGGRVAVGLGQEADALAAFRAVRRECRSGGFAYDCALASLEEAVLLFRRGEYARVQQMVLEDMAWVFRAAGVHREARAALELFRLAVEREKATQELARRVFNYLLRAEKNPDLRFEE